MTVATFESLFKIHYASVLNLCGKRLGNALDAEDAAQETFIRFLGHGESVVEPLPWLLRVAAHLCIDQIRRSQRIEEGLSALMARWDGSPRAENGVEFEDDVDGLLAVLTEAEKRVVTCSILDDRSHDETALILGIATSTSRVLRCRALKKLRNAEQTRALSS